MPAITLSPANRLAKTKKPLRVAMAAAPTKAKPVAAPVAHNTPHNALVRILTCGSVDDGKSTLIGRLLYDSKMIFEDQLAALEADSKRVGTQGQEIDFALLVDGLAAEREQGITMNLRFSVAKNR